MTVMCGGELRHGYKVNESPRQAEFFTQTILDSFSPGRTFMSQLRITRFFASYAVELRDRKLVSCGRDWSNTTTLNSMAELKRAISDQFSMPRCPVEKAVAILEQLTARPFFGG